MTRSLLFVGVILSLLMGCRPIDLERPNVPIAWGMRFDTPAAAGELNSNLAKLREMVMRELVIELPLRADSAGLPIVPPLPLGDLSTLLGRYKVGLHLVFAPSAQEELFPEGRMKATPAAWFAALQQQVDSTLRLLKHYPIDRVVIGSHLGPVEQYTNEWGGLLDGLRKGRKTLFSYGSDPSGLRKLGFLAHCDELAIDYPPAADDNPKPFSRAQNTLVAQLADSLQKPVFIFRANIMGEQQAEQFQNRLRFWPDQVQLNGVVVNSLYARIPMLDSTSYYGLADNPEFSAFLKEYRQRGQ